jgi:hypothetical protein
VTGEEPGSVPDRPGSDELRTPALIVVAGFATAAAALALAAAAGPPYLSASHVNGWIIVFAAGLFAGLLAVPFVVERGLRAGTSDRDRRWDRAVPLWGAVSLSLLALGLVAGAAGGFSGDSLAGSAGLLATIEAGLVVVALLFVLLSG